MPETPYSRQQPVDETILVCRSARLSLAAYQFYRAVLLTFVQQGDAPDPPALHRLAEQFGVDLQATLIDMAAQDLMQFDSATGRIQAAYPFSGAPTPHHVTLFADQSGEKINQTEAQVFAMCALDALGIPFMLRRSARIISVDALTGEPLTIFLRPPANSRDLPLSIPPVDWQVSWEPDGIAVYARSEEHLMEHNAETCAAGTCCPIINFFHSAEHARQWTLRQGAAAPVDGLVLTQTEALAYAHLLFAGVLDRLPQ